jgi:hemerythrin-like metal-binding protein
MGAMEFNLQASQSPRRMDEVDSQHRYIAVLFNRVREADALRVEQDCLVEKLLKYTEYHFADEESFMASINYPAMDYETHKKNHSEFIQRLATLRRAPLGDLLGYFQGWIEDHIRTKDALIDAHLKNL